MHTCADAVDYSQISICSSCPGDCCVSKSEGENFPSKKRETFACTILHHGVTHRHAHTLKSQHLWSAACWKHPGSSIHSRFNVTVFCSFSGEGVECQQELLRQIRDGDHTSCQAGWVRATDVCPNGEFLCDGNWNHQILFTETYFVAVEQQEEAWQCFLAVRRKPWCHIRIKCGFMCVKFEFLQTCWALHLHSKDLQPAGTALLPAAPLNIHH